MRRALSIDDVLLPAPEAGVAVDPLAWFASPGPLELEIGCGKGRFLLHRARSRPDVRLIGIEWANKICRYAADRMARWGVDNVRILRTDASVFVQTNLPEACLTALHVYHPDPWPKKRHHKRRLLQAAFFAAVARVLRRDGQVFVATDWANYAEDVAALVETLPAWRNLAGPGRTAPRNKARILTKFERRALREGRTVADFVFALR